MHAAARTPWIVERARAAGFDLCGVASLAPHIFSAANKTSSPGAERFNELRYLPEWLARGYGGEMNYLHDPRRSDPRSVLSGARSIIVVAVNYHSPHPLSTEIPPAAENDPPRGWISRYAWGDDYHEAILSKLKALIAEMRAEFAESFEARAYVDTGPIVERIAAKYAGLGWLAKNTCLINRRLGSWLFLGVIITTLDLEPSVGHGQAPPADLCGTCTRCIDACPTQAFPEPYVLDARRCISYLTIELRGAIPKEFREQMGRAAIGCDICQDVCPWNRKAPTTRLATFQPRAAVNEAQAPGAPASTQTDNGNKSAHRARPHSLLAPELPWLASLSQQEFSQVFRGSAVKRAKWNGLVRNACIALGNSEISSSSPDFPRIMALLENLAGSDNPLVAEQARWALNRLSPAASNRFGGRPR